MNSNVFGDLSAWGKFEYVHKKYITTPLMSTGSCCVPLQLCHGCQRTSDSIPVDVMNVIKMDPQIHFYGSKIIKVLLGIMLLNQTCECHKLVFVTELIFCSDQKSSAKIPLAFCRGNQG